MMDRTPETELMNEEQQAKAYAFADFSEPHDLFVEKFQEKFPNFNRYFNDVILELGCGSCDITRRFAKAYSDAAFHAVDGAKAMLDYAEQLNEEAGLSSRIKLVEGSIPEVKLPQNSYHVIISNSLLHHLHDPYVLWDTLQQHAKPFACFFIMDLIRPIDEQTVEFLASENVSNEPDILINDFKNSLRAAFTIKETQHQLDEMGLSNLTIEEINDHHMIIYGNLY